MRRDKDPATTLHPPAMRPSPKPPGRSFFLVVDLGCEVVPHEGVLVQFVFYHERHPGAHGERDAGAQPRSLGEMVEVVDGEAQVHGLLHADFHGDGVRLVARRLALGELHAAGAQISLYSERDGSFLDLDGARLPDRAHVTDDARILAGGHAYYHFVLSLWDPKVFSVNVHQFHFKLGHAPVRCERQGQKMCGTAVLYKECRTQPRMDSPRALTF